ncbi:MAG: FAD-binding oxidoreductase [Cyclobacteriaceae bacterium]|nr:MAG: FAD-binding oxidoreductase [Cyclobacteriaceae bacterium]
MNSETSVDHIIVGQGLAGSCLALQLIKEKKRVLVVDQFDKHSATQVAAGLFNPITGRVMSKTWKADILFPYLHDFYREAEVLTGSKFFHPMPLYRPFLSIEEQNEWMGKSAQQDFKDYIASVDTHEAHAGLVKNPFGGLTLRQAGWLDTVTFTETVRHYILNHGFFLNDAFHEDSLILKDDVVNYLNYSARKIIFCQGVKTLSGKLFSWIPIRPLKGETLTIQTDAKIDTLYNRGVFVVPDTGKVGATYQPNDQQPTVTEAARNELQSKLDELVCFPYRIITQSWGIRPTTPDRRPILGPHPEHPNAIIFNGLGTKGVSLAPYFSKVLATWIENRGAINKEVDIERYKHYNYGGNIPR